MAITPDSEVKDKLYTNVRVMILAIDALLINLGFGIVMPSMAYYLIALEGGLNQAPGPGYIVPESVVAEFALVLGVMMATFMFTRTLLARFWGDYSDKHGRKPLLILGMVGYVALLVLFGLAQNWVHLLIIRALQGVVSAMVWPVAEAALMDIVGPERRGEGLGLYMMVSGAGWILGPGVGGALYNLARDFMLLPVPDVFRVPYFISALICLPAIFLTAFVLNETSPGKTDDKHKIPDSIESDDNPEPASDDSLLPPALKKMIYALYAMSLVNGIAMGLGQPLFQLFLMSQITTDIGAIGAVISVAGLIGMGFSIPAGRYADKHGRKGLAVWGAVTARASLGALPLTTNLAETSVIWVAQSAAMSASQPAMRAIQADIVPWSLRGKLFGTLQACFNAGATIGPLAGGWLYGVMALLVYQIGPFSIQGYVIPFWIASFSGLVGAFLLWKYVKETLPMKVTKIETEEPVTDAT